MGYARQRVTEELLKRHMTLFEYPKNNGQINDAGIIHNASLTITLEKEWKNFRRHSQFMQNKMEEFEKAGQDLATYKPWLDLCKRFEKNVIAPLEQRWKLEKYLYDHPETE